MPARKTAEEPLRNDAEELLKEMARDSLRAARTGWRFAGRVGRWGMARAEETTERLAHEIDRRRHRPPSRP